MNKNIFILTIISLMSSYSFAATNELGAGEITVKGQKTNSLLPEFPSTAVSIDAKEIADTVNAVDTSDVLKYMPGIFVRKRDSADYTGAPISTRIWGNAYSAKTIVNIDGVPITNQIFQNNTYGSPKWWITSPEEIQTVEVMYGPFSPAPS